MSGAGSIELAGRTVRFRPNGVNASMLDILEPHARGTQVDAQLDAGELARGSDVWIFRFPDCFLLDIKVGSAGQQKVGSGQHLLWLVPQESVTGVDSIIKKKTFGSGTKTLGVVVSVKSLTSETVREELKLTFFNGGKAESFGQWAKTLL